MNYANRTTTLTVACILCKTEVSAIVGSADLARYRAGVLVQNAFPEAPVATREVVMGTRTGMFVCDFCMGPENG